MRKRRDIELEARRLLENNAVSRPPIPVGELAAALHIDVRFSAGKDDVSGAADLTARIERHVSQSEGCVRIHNETTPKRIGDVEVAHGQLA